MTVDAQTGVECADAELARQLAAALVLEKEDTITPAVYSVLNVALRHKLYGVAEVCALVLGDDINRYVDGAHVADRMVANGSGVEALEWLVQHGVKLSGHNGSSVVREALLYCDAEVLCYAVQNGLGADQYDLRSPGDGGQSVADYLYTTPLRHDLWACREPYKPTVITDIYDILYQRGLYPTINTMTEALFHTTKQPMEMVAFTNVIRWLLAHRIDPDVRIMNPYNRFRGSNSLNKILRLLAKLPGAVRDDPLIACMAEWRWARIWHLDDNRTIKWCLPMIPAGGCLCG